MDASKYHLPFGEMVRQGQILGNPCMAQKWRLIINPTENFPNLRDSLVDDILQANYHTKIALVHLNTIREGEEMVRQGQILGNPCMAEKWRLIINPTESFPNLLESISWQYPQSWFCTRKRCIWRPQRMRNREKECRERNTEGSAKSLGLIGDQFSQRHKQCARIVYICLQKGNLTRVYCGAKKCVERMWKER